MILLTRAQIGTGVPGLDITVKSAVGTARLLAPTWDMVMGHKKHTITNDEYARRYREILNNVPYYVWTWLEEQHLKNGILTFLCYCPNVCWDGSPKFCHTRLLMSFMVERWPSHFQFAASERSIDDEQ